MYVGESRREPLEDRVIQLLPSAADRLPRALHELINSPVAGRHTNDGALEKPALFQPVQRSESHYLGQVSGDTEDHEDIGLLLSESRRTVTSHHRRPPEPDWATNNPDLREPKPYRSRATTLRRSGGACRHPVGVAYWVPRNLSKRAGSGDHPKSVRSTDPPRATKTVATISGGNRPCSTTPGVEASS